MTTKELLQDLLAGKKMRMPSWDKGYYVFINEDGCLMQNNKKMPIGLCINCANWEEYKEEILDKEEKEYLEAVLRPFKDRVDRIVKYFNSRVNRQFIYIFFTDDVGIKLPYFKANTMYKGMEVDKKYTLKELGLFDRKIF